MMPATKTSSDRGTKLKAVRPNAGIYARYRRLLMSFIRDMNIDYRKAVGECWKIYPIAQDSTPAEDIAARMSTLGDTWLARLDEIAVSMAEHLADSIWHTTDVQLYGMITKLGFSVDFQLSEPIRNSLDAIVAENVSLIKSIAQEYQKNIMTTVMEGVTEGRNVRRIYQAMRHTYGVTERRAKLIAFDQTNKATSAINRVRQRELGITKAIWRHSHGGKRPRPEHVEADGKEYNIEKGMYLEGKWTWPGREINCRCTSESIFPWRRRRDDFMEEE